MLKMKKMMIGTWNIHRKSEASDFGNDANMAVMTQDERARFEETKKLHNLSHSDPVRHCLQNIVEHRIFQPICTLVIAANALCMALTLTLAK